jgi:hypothetical protein
LVALVNFMRLSLMKAAHGVVSNAVKQEIRVRSVEMTNLLSVSLGLPIEKLTSRCNGIVISTGGVMGLWPTQADENQL